MNNKEWREHFLAEKEKEFITILKKMGDGMIHDEFCEKKGKQFKKCCKCFLDNKIDEAKNEIQKTL